MTQIVLGVLMDMPLLVSNVNFAGTVSQMDLNFVMILHVQVIVQVVSVGISLMAKDANTAEMASQMDRNYVIAPLIVIQIVSHVLMDTHLKLLHVDFVETESLIP